MNDALQQLLDRLTALLAEKPLIGAWYTTVVRFVFPLLALMILVGAIRSLWKVKHPDEVWGYLVLRNGVRLPITHWENIIGRAPSCDVQLEYPSVSRQHAALIREDDGSWTIYDLGSKGGIKVNDLPVDEYALVEDGDTCQQLMGLSLRNVQLTVYENDKKLYSDFGEMLFTHFGLSGPLVLSASAHMRHFGSKKYRVEIDLKPALDEKTLDKRLLTDFDKHKNSDFINALGELLPRKMIPVVIEKSGIDPREKVNSITKAQRAALLRVLKAFPVEISGKRPIAEAIITTGGVSVREVSPKTMESKKLPHLYFAGEVLDVDAYTGGFNLQIAWSTGRLAGLSATEEES